MQWNPYLAFGGNCREAFEFYAQAINGNLVMMAPYGDAPGCENMPDEAKKLIMHARLVRGDQILMGADSPPGMPYKGICGCSVAVQVGTPAEAEALFSSLSAGGNVTMPLQQTFWAVRFGMLTDKFGVAWMVNCEAPRT